MGFVVLYLGSIALSYFIIGTTAFQMARDIGNSGGKFNLNKLSDLSSLVNPEQKKLGKIMKFVPFLNVLYALKEGMEYVGNREDVLYQLSTFGAVEEMTEEEKKEFEKHPTGLNCFLISAKADSDKKKPNIEIKIEKTEEGTKVEVNSQDYTDKEKELAEQFFKYGIEKYGGVSEFADALRKNSDQIREEFIESFTKVNENNTSKESEKTEDKGRQYVKKNNSIK